MGFFDPFCEAANVDELKSDLNSVKSDVEAHINNNDIHVTASDKSNWNNKLDKNQGTENSGKVLGTNANGEVIPLNGYGFEYDEETKMLKYGTDPTTNLNQGIGLDDTLNKRGYAADAGAVGELKGDLDEITTHDIGKNIFFSEWSDDCNGLNPSTGEETSGLTGRRRTGFFDVEENTTYAISCVFVHAPRVLIVFYDENKTHLSYYETPYGFYPKTFTTPNGCKKCRILHVHDTDYGKPTNYQVEKGETATSYEEPYCNIVVPASKVKDIPNELPSDGNVGQVLKKTEDGCEWTDIPTDGIVVLKRSKNIGVTWESGTLQYESGEEESVNTSCRTGFVPVEPNKTYTVSINEWKNSFTVVLHYYKADETHISAKQLSYGYFPKVIDVPNNNEIAFMRLTMEKSLDSVDVSCSQAEENTMATSYRDADANEIPEALLPNSVCGYLGKKIIVFGDSITAIGEVTETANTGWTSYFKASVKPSEWYNFAIGGSTWCDYESGNFMSTEIENMKNANIADVDCVIFASGTNDTNITVPTDAEVESAFYDSGMNKITIADVDRTTWQGAMRYAVDSVRYLYPHAKIFICTPIQREYQSDEPVRSLYSTVRAKNEIIKKMCARLGVECIDTEQCGITGMRAVDFVDHLHPSVNGAKKIARYNTARFMTWFNQN